MFALLVELTQVRGKLLDVFADPVGLGIDLCLAPGQADQDRAQAFVPVQAPCQPGAAVPVGVRVVIVLAVQFTRDSAVRGLLSYSLVKRRCSINVP